ncbi:MAG: bifunctional folylpolyglutamate synthase/dihydrofolate synthase [Planctomycetota bacterium]
MRVSTAPARDLLRRLGDPQRGRPVVLVAGTKGKGSTLAQVEAALLRAGLHTALFTSPHVEHVTERVRLDGEPVAPARFAPAIDAALDAREAARRDGTEAAAATWFDVVIGASAVAASDPAIDVWLVEVGLGGRLDSTNALDPWVCGVTSIELEHTAVLGDTREAIAAEKAGVARSGRVLVHGLGADDPAGRRVEEVARAAGAIVRGVGAGGGIDQRNGRLARALLDALGEAFDAVGRSGSRPSGALLDGLEPPRLPGRLELFPGPPPVVLDGAHVPEALALVLGELAGRPGLRGAPDVVFSCARDKRADELLKVLAGRAETLISSSLPEGRSETAGELAERARRVGLAAEPEDDPVRALEAAMRRARARGGWVLVTGSLHLLGPPRAHLRHLARCSPSSPTCS